MQFTLTRSQTGRSCTRVYVVQIRRTIVLNGDILGSPQTRPLPPRATSLTCSMRAIASASAGNGLLATTGAPGSATLFFQRMLVARFT